MEQTPHDRPLAKAEGNDLDGRLMALENALEQVIGQFEATNERLASIEGGLAGINRGLGAASARVAALEQGTSESDKGLFARMRGWRAAIATRRGPQLTLPEEDTRTEGAAPYTVLGRPPLIPNVDRAPVADAAAPPRVIVVTAFELAAERLERVLDTVEAYAAKRHVAPVILTDCSRFEVFRRRNMAFEYLPPTTSRARFADDLQWDIYLGRRLALLRAKWRPIGIISFGSRGPVGGASALDVLGAIEGAKA